jgi:RNA polymerase sigma factor (sigma-70 family)
VSLPARRRAAGDDTVEALFRRHAPELRRHAERLLRGSAHDPEDVLQEVVLRVLARHGDGPLGLEFPKAWLHACVHNACLSHLRSGGLPPAPLDEALPAAGDRHELDVLVSRIAEAREVLEDLARLDARQRRALLASALGDEPHAALAAQLGGSEGGVTSLVSRARVNMKALRVARHTPCAEIRAEIDLAVARSARAPELVRRHTLSCRRCRLYAAGRRHRARIAGLLAPLHGLVSQLGPRLGDAAAPAAADAGVFHGLALVAVLAGGAGSHVLPNDDGPHPVVAVHHARTVTTKARIAPPPVAAPSTAGRPVAAIGKRVVVAQRQRAAVRREHRETAPPAAKTVERNLFGCPKVVGRMTAADIRCREDRRGFVRAAIDARLARHRAAAEAKAAAAAATSSAPAATTVATPAAPVPAAATSAPATTTAAPSSPPSADPPPADPPPAPDPPVDPPPPIDPPPPAEPPPPIDPPPAG